MNTAFKLSNMHNQVNFIEHWKSVMRELEEEPNISTLHISLYNVLFNAWNVSGFKDKIEVNRKTLMSKSKIKSHTTYHKVMKELQQLGYIDYYSNKSNYSPSEIGMIRFDVQRSGRVRKLVQEVHEMDKASPFNGQASPSAGQASPLNGHSPKHTKHNKTYISGGSPLNGQAKEEEEKKGVICVGGVWVEDLDKYFQQRLSISYDKWSRGSELYNYTIQYFIEKNIGAEYNTPEELRKHFGNTWMLKKQEQSTKRPGYTEQVHTHNDILKGYRNE